MSTTEVAIAVGRGKRFITITFWECVRFACETIAVCESLCFYIGLVAPGVAIYGRVCVSVGLGPRSGKDVTKVKEYTKP